MRSHFSRAASSRRVAYALTTIAIAACGSDSPVAPASTRGPSAPLSSRQATTSSRILFLRQTGTTNLLYSMDDDGANVYSPSAAFASVSFASWAPDGKRIVLSAWMTGQATGRALFSMNQDGTEISSLTTPPSGCSDGYPASLGKQIVFVRACSVGATLIIMNADGTGLTPLVEGVDDGRIGTSPKGTEVVYAKGEDIWLLNVATGGRTNLTNTPGFFEFDPAFSPSGKRIAFTRGEQGNLRIFTMERDGTLQTLVAIAARAPVWSPDGKRIAFTGQSFDALEVYVANADGTGVTNLTGTPSITEEPTAWMRY
jgi:TolB protein